MGYTLPVVVKRLLELKLVDSVKESTVFPGDGLARLEDHGMVVTATSWRT